jgi:hypothetical protein
MLGGRRKRTPPPSAANEARLSRRQLQALWRTRTVDPSLPWASFGNQSQPAATVWACLSLTRCRTGCHQLRPLGPIKAPSSVATPGYDSCGRAIFDSTIRRLSAASHATPCAAVAAAVSSRPFKRTVTRNVDHPLDAYTPDDLRDGFTEAEEQDPSGRRLRLRQRSRTSLASSVRRAARVRAASARGVRARSGGAGRSDAVRETSRR